MKVKITTDFGEMSFDMPQGAALSLLDQAMKAANACESKAAWEPTPEPVAPAHNPEEYIITKEPPVPVPEAKAAPRSRAETMFGDRSKWDMPAAGKGKAERPDGQEAYKGFLYIQCEKCGEVKGYNAKYPSTYHKCSCGHRQDMRDLRLAHVNCKCGDSFNYRTNLQHDFTIPCLRCGSPVDMELGAKGTAFVTVGQKFSGGVHDNVNRGKPYVFRQNHRY